MCIPTERALFSFPLHVIRNSARFQAMKTSNLGSLLSIKLLYLPESVQNALRWHLHGECTRKAIFDNLCVFHKNDTFFLVV